MATVKEYILNKLVIRQKKDSYVIVEDIAKSGADGGNCPGLTDTITFYNEHEMEIWEKLADFNEDLSDGGSTGNILEYITRLEGSNEVGNLKQFKTLLSYWIITETARDLMMEVAYNEVIWATKMIEWDVKGCEEEEESKIDWDQLEWDNPEWEE